MKPIQLVYKLQGLLDSNPKPVVEEYKQIVGRIKSVDENSHHTLWMPAVIFMGYFKIRNSKNFNERLAQIFAVRGDNPEASKAQVITDFSTIGSAAPTKVASEHPEALYVDIRTFYYVNYLVVGRHEVDEKFDIIMKLFRKDGINKTEMAQMIQVCTQKNEMAGMSDRVGDMVDILFELIDKDNTGKVTRENFKNFFKEHQDKQKTTLDRKPRSQAAAGKAPAKSKSQQMTDYFYLKFLNVFNWFRTEFYVIIWFIIFFACYILFFFREFIVYVRKQELLDVVGYAVPFSRGFAGAIKYSSVVVLICVCRGVLTWFRTTVFNDYIPIDENLRYHKLAAMCIWISGIGHAISHWINGYNISKGDYLALRIAAGNWFDYPGLMNNNIARYMLSSIPGFTGHALLVIMTVIVLTGHKRMRRVSFEAFWYIHHIFILYFILLLVHGMGALLKEPEAWVYIIVPGFLYMMERFLRARRGKYKLQIAQLKLYPAETIRVELKKPPGFNYVPGQYIFINCPNVSYLQWHPFTLTSSPEQDTISVHIRCLGNWTRSLAGFVGTYKDLDKIDFYVDGPFGASSQYVFDYRVIAIVGAGIGVTPYAATLKHIKIQMESRKYNQLQLQKVHFYWVCREQLAFSWFSEMIRDLENKMEAEKYIEINTYVTSARKRGDLASFLLWLALEMYHNNSKQDAITNLTGKTNFGRPDFNKILKDMSNKYRGEDIGVFFCGPKPMMKTLQKACFSLSGPNPGDTKFHFHREHF